MSCKQERMLPCPTCPTGRSFKESEGVVISVAEERPTVIINGTVEQTKTIRTLYTVCPECVASGVN